MSVDPGLRRRRALAARARERRLLATDVALGAAVAALALALTAGLAIVALLALFGLCVWMVSRAPRWRHWRRSRDRF